jgi:preprotein translocase subunit SecF
MLLKLVPDHTTIDFIGKRFVGFALTLLLLFVGLGALFTKGLNMGIDFKGGILIDASFKAPVDVGSLRAQLDGLALGEVSLQTFGNDSTVLIRLQQQEGGDASNAAAVEKIKGSLGEGWTYNRAEAVGPTVGAELLKTGIYATLFSLLAITAYVAFRFEWQFGVAALVSTFHDVFVALGLVAVLGWEFNLTTVAALLLLAGYSVNDTVIVFDRIRENLRKYKTKPMTEIINLSTNSALSRTILTSLTTALAILPMFFMGGEGLINFTGVILFGIVVGTFSSTYVAAALLLYMPPLRMGKAEVNPAAEGQPQSA